MKKGFLMILPLVAGVVEGSAADKRRISNHEVVIRGTVKENYIGCPSDGTCYLEIQTDKGLINYIYGTGFLLHPVPCLNDESAKPAFYAKEGDEVEIFGQLSAEYAEMSTCNSKSYFFKIIRKAEDEHLKRWRELNKSSGH